MESYTYKPLILKFYIIENLFNNLYRLFRTCNISYSTIKPYKKTPQFLEEF